MKPVFLILIASGFLCLSAHGKTLGDAQIRSIVTKAISDFTITGGDRGWSGGVRSNADMNHVLFDANSAYFLITPKKSSGTPNAKEIAEEIRQYLIKAFDYPTSRPSSIWSKEQPIGTEPGTFSEVYLRTFPNSNDRSKAMLYMTIQVAQVSPNTYGLTVSYTALGEQYKHDNNMAERAGAVNPHAFGTFVMAPALSASRAGAMPKASGDT